MKFRYWAYAFAAVVGFLAGRAWKPRKKTVSIFLQYDGSWVKDMYVKKVEVNLGDTIHWIVKAPSGLAISVRDFNPPGLLTASEVTGPDTGNGKYILKGTVVGKWPQPPNVDGLGSFLDFTYSVCIGGNPVQDPDIRLREY